MSYSSMSSLTEKVSEVGRRFRSFVLEPEQGVRSSWKGHPTELRQLNLLKGSFLVLLVKVDDWNRPSTNLPVAEYILTQEGPQLEVPKGHVISVEAIEADSARGIFQFFRGRDQGSSKT